MSDLPARAQAYRSAALLHAGLAVVILAVAAISGGSLPKAITVACGYFVAATGWSWFRFWQREKRARSPADSGRGEERP